MPIARIERIEQDIEFTATATVEFARVQNNQRVIGCTCRVVRAGNGTGTVSIGRTGSPTVMMTTADVGAGVAGLKTTASGSDLAGNGTKHTADTPLVVDYIQGTNTVHPIIRVTVLFLREDVWANLVTK
jgi:hypothetical protein